MKRDPNQHHLTEEYRYSSRPSIGKFRKSRASVVDVGTTALTLYAVLSIGYDAVFAVVGWGDVIVFIVAGLLVRHYGSKVYDALFMPLSGHSQAEPVADPSVETDGAGTQQRPYWDWDGEMAQWIAEIDRYSGKRDDEYHRELVCVVAASMYDAAVAVKNEHNTTDNNIVRLTSRLKRENATELTLST